MEDFKKYTCVRFLERKKEKDYIKFYSGVGCWSHVGKQSGTQLLSLGDGCEFKGTVIHEIMHALGWYHEHTRLDRDKFIKIHWDKIKPGMDQNFHKYATGTADFFNEPYDYDSIMHYPSTAFSNKGDETITVLGNAKRLIGQRRGFSEIDLKQINKRFNCKVKIPPTPSADKPSPTKPPSKTPSSGITQTPPLTIEAKPTSVGVTTIKAKTTQDTTASTKKPTTQTSAKKPTVLSTKQPPGLTKPEKSKPPLPMKPSSPRPTKPSPKLTTGAGIPTIKPQTTRRPSSRSSPTPSTPSTPSTAKPASKPLTPLNGAATSASKKPNKPGESPKPTKMPSLIPPIPANPTSVPASKPTTPTKIPPLFPPVPTKPTGLPAPTPNNQDSLGPDISTKLRTTQKPTIPPVTVTLPNMPSSAQSTPPKVMKIGPAPPPIPQNIFTGVRFPFKIKKITKIVKIRPIPPHFHPQNIAPGIKPPLQFGKVSETGSILPPFPGSTASSELSPFHLGQQPGMVSVSKIVRIRPIGEESTNTAQQPKPKPVLVSSKPKPQGE